MICGALADLLARRGWENDASAAPGSYTAALATNPAGSLDHSSVVGDLAELAGEANEGYARAALTAWAKGTGAEDIVAQCAGFENTGAAAWEAVNYVCVMAPFDGSDVLCWFEAIDPPIALGPSDTITFPSGVRFTLEDGGA